SCASKERRGPDWANTLSCSEGEARGLCRPSRVSAISVLCRMGKASQNTVCFSAHDRSSSTPSPEIATHSSRNPGLVLVHFPRLVESRERLCNKPVCRLAVPRSSRNHARYGDDGRHGAESTGVLAQGPSRIF